MVHGTDPRQSFSEKHHFLIRRLHSLSGLIPIGVFLVFHLTVNATIVAGGDAFQSQIDRIHSMKPFVVAAEVFGIFLPILFHAVVGLQIWFSGQPNVGAYKYGGNVRYTLQRVSGGIAFVFILYHLWHMHWLGKPLGGGFFEHDDGRAAETVAAAISQTVLGIPVAVFYVIGVVAAVYHLSNGIWTMLITWGVTISTSSQRASGYACALFGVALGVAGLSSIRGFRLLPRESETARIESAAESHAAIPPTLPG